MRHPFWRLTSWLSLGLAGCVHGWDGRKSVTQTVADQSDPTTRSLVVGPFLKKPATFVSRSQPQRLAAPAQSVVALPDPNVTRTSDSARPINGPIQQIEFVPPPAPPAEEIHPPITPKTSLRSTPTPPLLSRVTIASITGPFAEFERAIPDFGDQPMPEPVVPAIVISDEPEVVAGEDPELFPDSANLVARPQKATVPVWTTDDLPEIVPANRGKLPTIVTAEPINPSLIRSAERPAVADPTTPTTPTAETKPSAKDVSLLVDQVFDDLRQHRIHEARQRTEWLRRMVTKPAVAFDDASTSNVPLIQDQESSDE